MVMTCLRVGLGRGGLDACGWSCVAGAWMGPDGAGHALSGMPRLLRQLQCTACSRAGDAGQPAWAVRAQLGPRLAVQQCSAPFLARRCWSTKRWCGTGSSGRGPRSAKVERASLQPGSLGRGHRLCKQQGTPSMEDQHASASMMHVMHGGA
jgi:hypothetical protein